MGVEWRTQDEDETIPTLRIDPQIERDQIERTRAVRAKRTILLIIAFPTLNEIKVIFNQTKAENSLAKLEEAAGNDENMLPKILDCVEGFVTVGEISFFA